MAHAGTAQGARSRACPPGEKREDGCTNILLALLLLAFATLMASAWFMSRPPQGENQEPGEESTSESRGRLEEETLPGASPEKSGEHWQQILEKGKEPIRAGDGPPVAGQKSRQDAGSTNVSSAPPGDLEATRSLAEVEALGASVRAGDPVEIVWQSPDGATWKRVVDHPFAVLRVEGNRITIRTSPEEKSQIEAAKSSGRVFGVPP